MLSAITPVTVLTAIATFYGIAWLVMNVYNYYPVARAGVERVVSGQPNTEVSFVGTDSVELSDSSVYPSIDVFVPAYDEADVIHQSIKSIRNTAYPQEKLSLTVLLEADDDATIARVKELATEIDLDLCVVPADYPGSPNKPRALNYGFEQTDGDIVGIVDAENVVSENLFDRVSKAIVAEQCDYVQGMVDMVNEEDGWKNLLFRAEYGYWYRFILPAFKRLGFPIPLSGTTCFFRRDVLESISDKRTARKGDPWDPDDASWLSDHGLSGITPWDPTNVTEDFELGLQLWCTDYRFGIIESVTKEESPRTLENWLKQRTRWQKGKVFTFLDFFKHRAGKTRFQRGHLLWQSFLPHAGPLNVTGLLLLIGVGSALGFVPPNAIVSGILSFGLVFLVVGVASFAVGYWLTSNKPPEKKLFRTLVVLLTVPVYWVLQWAADIRAFKQLAVGDLGWEKTVHENHGRLGALQRNSASHESLRKALQRKVEAHQLLIPIVLLALALRLPNIDRSFWIDEIYTVSVRGSFNVFGIITTGSDPHPPLYYLVVHGWMRVFGRSEIAVRSLSLLFGLASVVAVYLLATEMYDKQAGSVAALLMAVSSFQIQFAQTARMYSMLVFLSTLSIYFYVRTLNEHTVDNRVGYALTTLLMLLTHIYAVFVVLAQLLHLGYKLFDWAQLAQVKKWLVTESMAGVFFIPWLGLVLLPNYLFASNDSEVRWLSEPGLNTLSDISLAYAGVPVNYPLVNISSYGILIGRIFTVGIILMIVWQLYVQHRNDESVSSVTMLVLLILSFTIIPFALSVTVYPLLSPRYTIVGFVAVAILIGKTISDINVGSKRIRQSARVAVVLIVVVAMIASLPATYRADSQEDWDRVSSVIENDLDESSVIIHNPGFTKDSLNYYLSDDARSQANNIRYQSANNTTERVIGNSYTQVWVVNIQADALEPVAGSLPSMYSRERTESIGQIDITEFRSNSTVETNHPNTEVTP